MLLQFHATRNELFEYAKYLSSTNHLSITCIQLFPFKYNLVNQESLDNFMNQKVDMILLSFNPPVLDSHDYWTFIGLIENSLMIQMGDQNDKYLKESTISILGSDEEHKKMLKKIINNYKKNLLKGAWVINPHNGEKQFYKNSYYTPLAQEVFKKGIKILPIGGWNHFILQHHIDE